jgi:nucleotide-binding universal stress UspA family protein
MAYKTILTHFNDEQRFAGMMRASVQLAKANGAHLVGMAVMPPIIIIPGSEADAGAVIEDHRRQYEPQLRHMREAFAAETAKGGISGEWLELDCENENPFGDVGSVAVKQARLADLVVASAVNPAWSLSGYLDVPETMIMNSGRPVLLLPNPPVPDRIGARVLLAWNDSREAVRAAFDALPLLTAADAVLVAQLGESSNSHSTAEDSSSGICKVLARHGAKAEVLQAKATSGNIGAALMEVAQTSNADLLVMGCYGHSRLRELVLGGASRHILQHVRVPVLMSH